MRILARRRHRTILFRERGQAATVNGARYRDTITQFFLPKLDDIDVADTWFQQDNAMCHIANETIQLKRDISWSCTLLSVIRIGPLDRVI